MNEQELRALARVQDIDPSTVLHEERELRLLAAIADDPDLATHLVFKGGTALRLIYGCDRYSDDLDFDIVHCDVTPAAILKRLRTIAVKFQWEVTDAWVKRRTILFETRERGWRRRLKIEISSLPRPLSMPLLVRNIVTPVFPVSVNVLTYPLPILLSGKMLAILERPYRTPRDLYDLFWLLSRAAEEETVYLRAAALKPETRVLLRDRRTLYRALLASVRRYADRQIATELGALLPRKQRQWAGKMLKERTAELLQLRLQAMA